MDLATAARKINETGYGYIASWALLTACEQRLFDRLPATAEDLSDTYPDPGLVDTSCPNGCMLSTLTSGPPND